MANTKRRLKDYDGKIFIPYNIGGGTGDEHFLSGGKLGILCALAVSNLLFFLNLYDGTMVWWSKVIITLLIAILDIYVIRLFVVNERYYYKVYKRLKDYRVTSPAVFWDIVSIKDTPEGAQLIYSDLKYAMMVRLERDTITGKPADFKETHFDAISDFYRALNSNGYSFVQMNIMEQAGNDPRLQKLDELVGRATNTNVAELVEMQVAYIKNITRATLYESEYFLIYTRDANKARFMGTEINEMLYKLLDGAYIGFRIMESQEIMQFVKEMYSIKLFDPGEAMLNVFKKSSMTLKTTFEVRSVTYTNGRVEVFELEEEKIQKKKDAKKAGKKKKVDSKKVETSKKGAQGLKDNKFKNNESGVDNSSTDVAQNINQANGEQVETMGQPKPTQKRPANTKKTKADKKAEKAALKAEQKRRKEEIKKQQLARKQSAKGAGTGGGAAEVKQTTNQHKADTKKKTQGTAKPSETPQSKPSEPVEVKRSNVVEKPPTNEKKRANSEISEKHTLNELEALIQENTHEQETVKEVETQPKTTITQEKPVDILDIDDVDTSSDLDSRIDKVLSERKSPENGGMDFFDGFEDDIDDLEDASKETNKTDSNSEYGLGSDDELYDDDMDIDL